MKNFKEKTDIGVIGYLNKNCWLVKNLNHDPYKRCQYCGLKFRNCLFLHYQIISSILIIFFLILFVLIEGKVPILVIISIFTLVIIYGYFFNKSTEKIIKANFEQRKAKEALEELTEKLEERVDEQTKDIREKSKYLQELLNMKSDFLRVVNHQLNTPLSVMNSSFSMIKEGDLSQEQGMATVEGSLQRINQTVADFWNTYELEGEKMKMEPQKTDIASIVNKLIIEKGKIKLVQERKLKLLVKKPSPKIPLVWCDPKKIAHVISNLLDNAIFYTTKGNVVVYYELLNNNYLKVNVQDTGSGISEEDKKKLFQKFSRGSQATNLQPDGSGLGLYIARKIVEGNEGQISCVSKGVNQGSTFSFTVPVYTNQQPKVKAKKIVGREKKIVIFNKK